MCTCIYILMNASARSYFFLLLYSLLNTHAYTKINGIKKTCVSVLFYNMVVNIPKVMAYQLKVHNYFLLL